MGTTFLGKNLMGTSINSLKVIPAKAGIWCFQRHKIPAFAGMTIVRGALITLTVILMFQPFSAYAVEPSSGTIVAKPKHLQTLGKTINTTTRIIIKYKASASGKYLGSESIVTRVSSITGVNLSYMRKLGTGAHLVELTQSMSEEEINQIIAKLNADPEVEYAELDQRVTHMEIQ